MKKFLSSKNSIGNNNVQYRFYGAIAQLGERLNGIQEVRGSIPRSSTNFNQLFQNT